MVGSATQTKVKQFTIYWHLGDEMEMLNDEEVFEKMARGRKARQKF